MSSQEPSRGRSPFYSERSRVSPLPITGICCFHTHTNPLNPEPYFYPKRPRQFFSELCHYTTNQHHQCGVCRIPLGNSLGVSLPTLPVMIRRRGRRRCFVQRKRWSQGLYHSAVLTCNFTSTHWASRRQRVLCAFWGRDREDQADSGYCSLNPRQP